MLFTRKGLEALKSTPIYLWLVQWLLQLTTSLSKGFICKQDFDVRPHLSVRVSTFLYQHQQLQYIFFVESAEIVVKDGSQNPTKRRRLAQRGGCEEEEANPGPTCTASKT